MAAFTTAQLDYLGERRIGRLATVDASGLPHVVPVGMWHYNPELGTIDVSGRNFAATKKFRNVRAHPKAAFVIDDVASVDPWQPRCVMVQGAAEALERTDSDEALIRITPDNITSWGLGDDG